MYLAKAEHDYRRVLVDPTSSRADAATAKAEYVLWKSRVKDLQNEKTKG